MAIKQSDNDCSRCGYAAIVGRPNVGKSTLLNQLLGTKLCITSRKPQTTRHTILGIKTEGQTQCVFVDTPGLHDNQQNTMNRLMNRSVNTVIQDVDVVIFVVDSLLWNDADRRVLDLLKTIQVPVILVINKIDKIDKKEKLLPHLQMLSEQVLANKKGFEKIIPVSAFSQNDMELLFTELTPLLPEAKLLYSEDELSDRSERFFMSEIVREKIMRQLGDEVPYNTAVEIERHENKPHIVEIDALILVEREGQKRMIIGNQGLRLKQIGEQARKDMEIMLDKKVLLKLWVKVKRGWSDDLRALHSLGID